MLTTTTSALDRIVYFRYDMPVSNTYKLIEKLNRQCQNVEGQTILFYNLSTYEGDKISYLFDQKSFLTLTDVYEANADFLSFSAILEKYLDERVIDNTIVGRKDKNWQIVFVVHENSSFDEICRLIDISGLSKRAVELSFVVYDDDSNVHHSTYEEIIAQNITVLNF